MPKPEVAIRRSSGGTWFPLQPTTKETGLGLCGQALPQLIVWTTSWRMDGQSCKVACLFLDGWLKYVTNRASNEKLHQTAALQRPRCAGAGEGGEELESDLGDQPESTGSARVVASAPTQPAPSFFLG